MSHTAIATTPYKAWTGTKQEFADMKIWGCHVNVLDTNVSCTKLANRTHVRLFMKFTSTTRIKVYYNPRIKKFGCASHAYFGDELNNGRTLENLHKRTSGIKLILQFPQMPN